MKHLIILSLLMTLNCHAQEGQEQLLEEKSQNQKRPSWSQGLPERQSSLTPVSSVNKYKDNKRPEISSANDRNLNVEIGFVATQPIIDLQIEPAQPISNNRREDFDQYYSNDEKGSDDTSVNPLIAEYKWTPIKTTPIDVPGNFDENKSLKLNIHINPKGEVTRVTVADTVIPKRVFKSAERSILKWKFQAPSEIGITEDISKTFTIDIKTDA